MTTSKKTNTDEEKKRGALKGGEAKASTGGDKKTGAHKAGDAKTGAAKSKPVKPAAPAKPAAEKLTLPKTGGAKNVSKGPAKAASEKTEDTKVSAPKIAAKPLSPKLAAAKKVEESKEKKAGVKHPRPSVAAPGGAEKHAPTEKATAKPAAAVKPSASVKPPEKKIPPAKAAAVKPPTAGSPEELEVRAPKIAETAAPAAAKPEARLETATPPTPAPPPAPVVPKRLIKINEFETTKEFAAKLGASAADLIKKALGVGQIVTINQKIDKTLAEVLAADYNCEVRYAPIGEERPAEEKITGDTPRIPIVTVMGHVDHGKTTLLDAIRATDVAAGEHGGITQHIGAYRVKTQKGDVAFLDTPGHEAFTALRARGSKVTDMVVLVVSAADGVMPQTVEAINHARAAGVPIIVAINKIDVAGANPDKIKSELNQHNIAPEEWGGDVLMVEISARNKVNIDKLLDAIHLQAEMMELKCDPKKPATGAVIESRLDPRKGPCVTLMVRNGTLRSGDVFVAGGIYGKVRAMFDESGAKADEAKPSTPVVVLGASELPAPGDRFYVVKNERDARETVERVKISVREAARKPGRTIGLADLDKKEEKILRLILKADVAGSLEAIKDHIDHIEHPEFKIQIIHAGVGPVGESDVNLAKTTGSVIIGFNVKADAANQALADRHGVEVRSYRIVYELFSDIKKALEGLLEPKLQETFIGKAEIRKKFEISKVGTVAGCYVAEGKVTRGAKARIIRDGAIIYDGKISSLRRVKDDVASVDKGYECGITLENYSDIKENDVIEAYSVDKVKRLL